MDPGGLMEPQNGDEAAGASSSFDVKFDEQFDVVVVGYGFAGAVAAISAHDCGAKVLLIEKNARSWWNIGMRRGRAAIIDGP
ncbi:MAG: FAD-binding protein [Alphaproteobacteria bacterium]